MERFAAFLRGINLGGRRVRNDELRRLVADLGFEGVATFRASGNLVLDGTGTEEEIVERLEAGLEQALGYPVPVFLRGAGELLAISRRDPFPAEAVSASRGKPQVVLLRRRPKAAARRKALALASDEDRLAIDGRELHWLPSGGLSESVLDLRAIEAALGRHTIRTQGTIGQIAARHFTEQHAA